jgi:hypothetical protein
MQQLESFIFYIKDFMYIKLFTWKILFTQDADDMLEALELSFCENNIFHVNDEYYLHRTRMTCWKNSSSQPPIAPANT